MLRRALSGRFLTEAVTLQLFDGSGELTSGYTGRETLRARGAYYVVREAHKVESDQGIKEAIERLVSLLQGEEGRETRQDTIDDIVKQAKTPSGAVPPTEAAEDLRREEREERREDDDDMDVVEV